MGCQKGIAGMLMISLRGETQDTCKSWLTAIRTRTAQKSYRILALRREERGARMREEANLRSSHGNV